MVLMTLNKNRKKHYNGVELVNFRCIERNKALLELWLRRYKKHIDELYILRSEFTQQQSYCR
jgi:hypothetical protein